MSLGHSTPTIKRILKKRKKSSFRISKLGAKEAKENMSDYLKTILLFIGLHLTVNGFVINGTST